MASVSLGKISFFELKPIPNPVSTENQRSLMRRIFDVLCRYLPCLKSLALRFFPSPSQINVNPNPSPNRGAVSINVNSDPVHSGAMMGCHLITGINLDNPYQQFFYHANIFDQSEKEINNFMTSHPDWHYSLFFTKKTIQEVGVNDEQAVINRFNDLYQGRVLTVLYLNDEEMTNVDVEYNPHDTTIKVRGTIEHGMLGQDFVRSAQEFQGKMCPLYNPLW